MTKFPTLLWSVPQCWRGASLAPRGFRVCLPTRISQRNPRPVRCTMKMYQHCGAPPTPDELIWTDQYLHYSTTGRYQILGDLSLVKKLPLQALHRLRALVRPFPHPCKPILPCILFPILISTFKVSPPLTLLPYSFPQPTYPTSSTQLLCDHTVTKTNCFELDSS